MRKSARSKPAPIEPFLLGAEAEPTDGSAWYVYLFALTDCSAFKIGFSCNPLQRIATFSRRYFERFDLRQSQLLNVHTNDDARALEAALKTEFAPHRMAAPEWIPADAGGQTEWFSVVYFFDLPLYAESPDVLQFVKQTAYSWG